VESLARTGEISNIVEARAARTAVFLFTYITLTSKNIHVNPFLV